MNTIKTQLKAFATFVSSYVSALLAREYSGKVVLGALVAGLVFGLLV